MQRETTIGSFVFVCVYIVAIDTNFNMCFIFLIGEIMQNYLYIYKFVTCRPPNENRLFFQLSSICILHINIIDDCKLMTESCWISITFFFSFYIYI